MACYARILESCKRLEFYPLTSLLLGGGVGDGDDEANIVRMKSLWMARALAQHRHLSLLLAFLSLLSRSKVRLAPVAAAVELFVVAALR